jgi:glycosyltransferase involved in cell wall biosynthesis
VTVFLPAFNEVGNLEGAVRDIVAAGDAVLPDYEILIVDDGSTDGTGALADRLAGELPRVRVLHQPRNLGLPAGYRRALGEARFAYFSFLPGDREVSAESVVAIFRAVGAADIVAPYHGNSRARAWYRRILTWGSTTLINAAFALHLRYYQGPCVYPTALARALPSTSRGFFFLAEMLVHALRRGHTVVEVPLIHQERATGRSKAVSLRNIARAFGTIAALWWSLRVRGAAGREGEARA